MEVESWKNGFLNYLTNEIFHMMYNVHLTMKITGGNCTHFYLSYLLKVLTIKLFNCIF